MTDRRVSKAGYIVEIDPIVIEITAQPSGGILGQLLCALAGGADGPNLDLIADLLNDIIDLLNDLLGAIGG